MKEIEVDKDIVVDDVITWIETLAANEFCQGRSCLSKRGAFCCLGVANEIFHMGRNPHAGFLGSGIGTEPIPQLGLLLGSQKELAGMNDDGAEFPQIARAMLRNPGRFFEPHVAEGIKEHFWRAVA